MSDMNFRSLLGRSRKLLGRMRLAQSTDQSAGTFSLLALRLERDLARSTRGRSVLLTAADDEGVGVEAALELAWSLADELGHSVLVVDAGAGAGALTTAMGFEGREGLAEVLHAAAQPNAAVQACVLPTSHARVSVLPHGKAPAPTIRAEAIRTLLNNAAEHYDFTIVQGSLVVEAERCLAFGSLVDAAILMAVEDASTLEDIARGQRLLHDCGARRVALVLGNRAPALAER